MKVHHEGTGMPDEQNFTTHFLSVEDAIDKAGWFEGFVIHKAWTLWQSTLAIEANLRAKEGLQPSDRVRKVLHGPPAEPGVILENIFPETCG